MLNMFLTYMSSVRDKKSFLPISNPCKARKQIKFILIDFLKLQIESNMLLTI